MCTAITNNFLLAIKTHDDGNMYKNDYLNIRAKYCHLAVNFPTKFLK